MQPAFLPTATPAGPGRPRPAGQPPRPGWPGWPPTRTASWGAPAEGRAARRRDRANRRKAEGSFRGASRPPTTSTGPTAGRPPTGVGILGMGGAPGSRGHGRSHAGRWCGHAGGHWRSGAGRRKFALRAGGVGAGGVQSPAVGTGRGQGNRTVGRRLAGRHCPRWGRRAHSPCASSHSCFLFRLRSTRERVAPEWDNITLYLTPPT